MKHVIFVGGLVLEAKATRVMSCIIRSVIFWFSSKGLNLFLVFLFLDGSLTWIEDSRSLMALLCHQRVFVDIELELEALRQILGPQTLDFALAVDDTIDVAFDNMVEIDGTFLHQLLAAQINDFLGWPAAVFQRQSGQFHGQVMLQHQATNLGQETDAGVALENDAATQASDWRCCTC